MKVTVEILRKKPNESTSYIDTFNYEYVDESETVSTMLRNLNLRDLTTVDGKNVDPIAWQSSCLQKKCGACAMVINGLPRLACKTTLNTLGDKISLAPLKKFPVIEDLIVDRSILQENLKLFKAWQQEERECDENNVDLVYESSKCIMCGCCLDVCPNFYPGGKFFGAPLMSVTTRLIANLSKEEQKELKKQFNKHVFAGCGKSLNCKTICPREVDTEQMLINSVSMTLWKK